MDKEKQLTEGLLLAWQWLRAAEAANKIGGKEFYQDMVKIALALDYENSAEHYQGLVDSH